MSDNKGPRREEKEEKDAVSRVKDYNERGREECEEQLQTRNNFRPRREKCTMNNNFNLGRKEHGE